MTGDDRLEDSARSAWFLSATERRNPASDIRPWTIGNRVLPLVDGAVYFARLYETLTSVTKSDQIYLVDFRGDTAERLAGPGTPVGPVLAAVAARGAKVFGLIWRSQPDWLDQCEGANAELVRTVADAGGEVLLDSRTRRAGSHHQKFVVIRHPDDPARDVAFVGGIDLGLSRNDDRDHGDDPQSMDFPAAYGPHPPWHDVQVEIHGPAVGDIEHTFRERWSGSTILDLSSPVRILIDRTYHAGKLVGRELPGRLPDPPAAGTHAVQVLRTYPARLRRYPFAPLGERSIAHAYRKVFDRARSLIYIEDQYLFVADLLADARGRNAGLHLIAIVPRYPDKEGVARLPSLVGREQAIKVCRLAGRDRFARRFARDLRLLLWREHLDRVDDDPLDDLLDPVTAFSAMRQSADALAGWHDGGRAGPRPPGRLRPHLPHRLGRVHRPWAVRSIGASTTRTVGPSATEFCTVRNTDHPRRSHDRAFLPSTGNRPHRAVGRDQACRGDPARRRGSGVAGVVRRGLSGRPATH